MTNMTQEEALAWFQALATDKGAVARFILKGDIDGGIAKLKTALYALPLDVRVEVYEGLAIRAGAAIVKGLRAVSNWSGDAT
jgi:hypothetical protein